VHGRDVRVGVVYPHLYRVRGALGRGAYHTFQLQGKMFAT